MEAPETRQTRDARSGAFRLAAALTTFAILAVMSAVVPGAAVADDPPPTRLTLTNTVDGGSALPTAWTLTATAPTGALPGPLGVTGVTAEITPGRTYALAESFGDPAYYQVPGVGGIAIPFSTISWQCNQLDENGVVIPGYSDGLNGAVTVPEGFHVRCNAVNKPRPTVTVEQSSTQDDPTTSALVQFTATFSEPITALIPASLVTVGGTAGHNAVSTFGGPTTFTIEVAGMTQPGTVTVSLPAGIAKNADGIGTLASTSVDNTVTWSPEPPADETAPVVTCVSRAPVFWLNQAGARVYAKLVDETAPTTPQTLSKAVSTSHVGWRTVAVAGTDAAGNSGSVVCGYRVVYKFAGFVAPVKNWPKVNTGTKAGSTIGLKFALADKYGRPVTSLPGGAALISTPCHPAPTFTIGTVAANGVGVKNLGRGHYRADVKTAKSWAGSCRVLGFRLADGVPHVAAFQLRR